MPSQTISWDADKRDQLRAAYDQAVKDDAPSFKITTKPEGELDFVTSYAKYLLEYLDEQFGEPVPKAPKPNEGEESYTPGSGSWEGEGRPR